MDTYIALVSAYKMLKALAIIITLYQEIIRIMLL